eukprot:UN05969
MDKPEWCLNEANNYPNQGHRRRWKSGTKYLGSHSMKFLTPEEEMPESLPLSAQVHQFYHLSLLQTEEQQHLVLAFSLQLHICFH